MGDTGSLVLGFVVAVLCIRLMQVNAESLNPALPNTPVFTLSIVLIPVFDTLRVFMVRIWKGNSPFVADKTHIHHLLTNQGFSHAFAAKLICFVHGFILLEGYWLRSIKAEYSVTLLVAFMMVVVILLRNFRFLYKEKSVQDLPQLKN